MDTALPRRRTAIGATSLVVGPALMSVGDLFHPAESWNAAAQVAIIAESGSRWYAAHLLLFAGKQRSVVGFIVGALRLLISRDPLTLRERFQATLASLAKG